MSRVGNNFSTRVRDDLAKRAGHRCSFPECDKYTVGPSGASEDLSIASGWACHIYPASSRGPRGDLAPSGVDLHEIQNGIWMCETHGSLIDKNNGIDFSPQKLQKWKKNAENAARLRQLGLSPIPAIDALVVTGQNLWGIEIQEMRLELGRHTIIVANSELAYKVMMQVLGQVTSRPSVVASGLSRKGGFELELKFKPGDIESVRIMVSEKHLKYWVDGNPVDSIAGTYFPFFVDPDSISAAFDYIENGSSRFESMILENSRDRAIVQSSLADPFIAEKMARSLRDHDTIMVKDLRRDLNGDWEANCIGHQPESYFPLACLSSSEQLSVFLDLTFAAARLRREDVVLIVISDVILRFDTGNIIRFKKVCESLPVNVQVVMSTTRNLDTDIFSDWLMEVLHFEDKAPRSISQSSTRTK